MGFDICNCLHCYCMLFLLVSGKKLNSKIGESNFKTKKSVDLSDSWFLSTTKIRAHDIIGRAQLTLYGQKGTYPGPGAFVQGLGPALSVV